MPTKRSSNSGDSSPTPPAAPAQPSPARPPEPALTTPLRDLTFVRAAEADALERLELRTVADLIRHLPMRYERLEAEAPIANLQDGDNVSARGEITATKVAGNRYSAAGKSRFQAVLVDDSGRLDLIWFNMPYMQKRVFPGMRVRVQGTAKRFGPGLQIVNPRLEVLNPEGGSEPAARDARLRPVYPASETINSQQIERIMGAALPGALPLIPDHLPDDYRKAKEMPSLAEAYRMAHQPASEAEGHEARRRLAFDELLMLQLGVFMRRAQVRRTTVAPALPWSETIDSHIRARFPFPLTPAQDQVVQEIIKDLGKADPANRLIQGDVGSGKTVVALYAMLMAVTAQKQAAIMAPTEILAEQHWYSITEMLKGSNVKLSLLTGAVTGREREDTLNAIKSGAIDIVVGTHALLGESVQFHDLGVVVIDEQHRFGVHQRAALRAKGRPSPDGRPFTPHILVMTATPIPRTLALTLFGDLDVSTIRGLPPGRQPILTKHVSPDTSAEVYQWVGTRIDAGEQAYVVVPAIDTGASSAGNGGDSELNDLRTVQARLEAHELAGKRIAALHGRLHSRTRENIMGRFRAGLIDCLIATTVIEVGVDVPNATVMVVEHAEQFGLAQLHQLRGRIGRGKKRSVCVLIGEAKTPDAEARLKVMVDTRDGFELAERDLEIRGPGEFFGMRQAGAPPFLIADLMHDRELLAMARRDAAAWIDRSPDLRAPGEDLLRKRLMRLHGKWLGLGDVG